MAYQNTFKRYELKYLLTLEEKQILTEAMRPFMAMDKYGRTVIRNLYFDTDNYRLIRRSIEKPLYKEKLRLRSYCQAQSQEPVFVELKKKYKGIVYKRRLSLPENTALSWLSGDQALKPKCQIGEEIDYFREFYVNLHPVAFLSYAREAWYTLDNSDFRVTFDDTILCRQDKLSLAEPEWGKPILPNDRVLMEIKTSGGIPLWMTCALTKAKIYKTSFSKYGTAYQKLIFPNIKGVNYYG